VKRGLAVASCAAVVLGGSLAGVMALAGNAPQAETMLVYFGTYTNDASKGIYVSRLDLASGALTAPELAVETTSPSFLALHPSRRYLYAANEVRTFEGQETGAVSAFAIDAATGRLTTLNQQSSGGSGPAHLVVDRSGQNVLVANYGGGSVAVLPVGTDGRLRPPSAVVQHTGSSVNPKRQSKPYAHSINVDPGNRFAYAADLGIDKVMIYRFDPAAGTLVANDPASVSVAPGSGPRHFAFDPTGSHAYVINEMLMTITAFSHDAARGALAEVQTISTLPPGQDVAQGFSTAEVQVHPSGRFVYGSNRGHDSVTVFARDASSGRLTFLQNVPTQGEFPRNFGIDPSGRYLLAANQRSNSVVVFRIDQETGRLTPTGHSVTVGTPVCVTFVAP
jgi:6-phosphogluconolactonase